MENFKITVAQRVGQGLWGTTEGE